MLAAGRLLLLVGFCLHTISLMSGTRNAPENSAALQHDVRLSITLLPPVWFNRLVTAFVNQGPRDNALAGLARPDVGAPKIIKVELHVRRWAPEALFLLCQQHRQAQLGAVHLECCSWYGCQAAAHLSGESKIHLHCCSRCRD